VQISFLGTGEGRWVIPRVKKRREHRGGGNGEPRERGEPAGREWSQIEPEVDETERASSRGASKGRVLNYSAPSSRRGLHETPEGAILWQEKKRESRKNVKKKRKKKTRG